MNLLKQSTTELNRLTDDERRLMKLILQHVTHLMDVGANTTDIQIVTADMNRLAYCVAEREGAPLNRGAYIGAEDVSEPESWVEKTLMRYDSNQNN